MFLKTITAAWIVNKEFPGENKDIALIQGVSHDFLWVGHKWSFLETTLVKAEPTQQTVLLLLLSFRFWSCTNQKTWYIGPTFNQQALKVTVYKSQNFDPQPYHLHTSSPLSKSLHSRMAWQPAGLLVRERRWLGSRASRHLLAGSLSILQGPIDSESEGVSHH